MGRKSRPEACAVARHCLAADMATASTPSFRPLSSSSFSSWPPPSFELGLEGGELRTHDVTMIVLCAFSGREIWSGRDSDAVPLLPLPAPAPPVEAIGSAKNGSVISTSGVGGSIAAPPPFECASWDWWSSITERSVPSRRWSHCAIVNLPTPGKPLIQTSGPGVPPSSGDKGGGGSGFVV